MVDTVRQSDQQASVRAVTGTTLDYNGDWSALFDLFSIPTGDWNGRLLAWINNQLGSSYTEINGAMSAFAVSQGANDWSGMGTFTIGGLGAGYLPYGLATVYMG